MKRSNTDLPLWKKITTGKLYPFAGQRNRRVKPQEKIRCSYEELKHVLQHFELVENGKGEFKIDDSVFKIEEPETPDAPPKDEYSVESAGSGWYNVLSPEGKTMNEKKLRQDEAEELRESLEEETDQ